MYKLFVCVDKFFSEDECDRIVSLTEEKVNIEEQEGRIGNKGDSVDSVRISKVRWINRVFHSEDFQWLFEKLDKATSLINNQYFDIDYRYDGCSALQYTTYYGSENGWYDQHMDHFMPGTWPDARKFTFAAQLSSPDDYEGGRFTFRDTGEEQPPEEFSNRGSILFFPSIQFHGVDRVTAGTRRSLVGWYRGPQWR